MLWIPDTDVAGPNPPKSADAARFAAARSSFTRVHLAGSCGGHGMPPSPSCYRFYQLCATVVPAAKRFLPIQSRFACDLV